MKRCVLIILAILSLVFVGAVCLVMLLDVSPGSEKGEMVETAADALNEEAPLRKLEISAQKNSNEELVFDLTLDEFIDSYNGYYWQDHNERYLHSADEWQKSTLENSAESAYPATQYTYRAEKNVWTLPVVNVLIPKTGAQIQQVDLNYDEHSYSEATYALFEKDCYYTLKVFFPDLSEEELISLYQTINQSAYDHTFPSDQQYRTGSARLPAMLCYRDGVGVFGYFAIGAPVHFCVIPVDEVTIAEYKAGGVDVREIGA